MYIFETKPRNGTAKKNKVLILFFKLEMDKCFVAALQVSAHATTVQILLQ